MIPTTCGLPGPEARRSPDASGRNNSETVRRSDLATLAAVVGAVGGVEIDKLRDDGLLLREEALHLL